MKIDAILKEIGEFGSYQKKIYFLICLPSGIIAFGAFLSIFSMAIPPYRCALPGVANDSYKIQNEHHEMLVDMAIPRASDGTMYRCSIYNVSGVNTSSRQCDSWVFDKTYNEDTVITKFGLVCGETSILRANTRMYGTIGTLFGVLFFGVLADYIGRKKTMVLSIVLSVANAFAQAWSVSYLMYAILMVVGGFVSSGVWQNVFVIGMELVGPSKRVWAGIVIELFWVAGELTLVLIAYFIREWQILQTVVTAPMALFILLYWIIPESPRWLQSVGRHEEAEDIIRKIAKNNDRPLPANCFDREPEKEEPQGKFIDIFKSKIMLTRSLILFYNWFVISAVYYGLSFNSGNLSGNPYLNFTLSTLVEGLAYVICLLFLDRIGRRALHCTAMIVGGVACIITIFPALYGTEDHEWIITTLSLIGKCGASAAFAIMYVFTAEIYPTMLRSTGIGICSAFARAGGMSAPYLADLGLIIGGQFGNALPVVVSGAVTLIGGLISLFLPETLNRDLPRTITEAESIRRSSKEKLKPNKWEPFSEVTNGSYKNYAYNEQ